MSDTRGQDDGTACDHTDCRMYRRLWAKVTEAIKKNDQDAATDAKSAIEDRQREIAKQREHSGETWKPRFFTIRNDEHRPLVECVCPAGTMRHSSVG